MLWIGSNIREEKNPKISDKGSKKKSSYDLEDEDDNKSNLGETSKELKIEGEKKEIELDLSKMIKGPGFFTIDIIMKNKVYGLKEHIKKTIRSYSEIKIESINFEIIDKIHDENSQHFSSILYFYNQLNFIYKEEKIFSLDKFWKNNCISELTSFLKMI